MLNIIERKFQEHVTVFEQDSHGYPARLDISLPGPIK